MDADHAKPFTTVRAACLASPALAATNVRFYSATVAEADSEIIRANLDYLSCQLVSEHSRISVNRVPSGKCVKIASTDPNLADAHDCLSRGEYGDRGLRFHKFSRAPKDDLPHKRSLKSALSMTLNRQIDPII
jgi:hypothetical protein